MNIESFLEHYNERLKEKNPSIRNGQLFMNLLYEVRSDLYNLLLNTQYDVFYKDDQSVCVSIEYLRNKW